MFLKPRPQNIFLALTRVPTSYPPARCPTNSVGLRSPKRVGLCRVTFFVGLGRFWSFFSFFFFFCLPNEIFHTSRSGVVGRYAAGTRRPCGEDFIAGTCAGQRAAAADCIYRHLYAEDCAAGFMAPFCIQIWSYYVGVCARSVRVFLRGRRGTGK